MAGRKIEMVECIETGRYMVAAHPPFHFELKRRLMERLAEVQNEAAEQAFRAQLAAAPSLRTAEELRDVVNRARGEDRWPHLGYPIGRSDAYQRTRSREGLPDKPPALAPPDPKRLPMWMGPR